MGEKEIVKEGMDEGRGEEGQKGRKQKRKSSVSSAGLWASSLLVMKHMREGRKEGREGDREGEGKGGKGKTES
jgi:hypothetical protein